MRLSALLLVAEIACAIAIASTAAACKSPVSTTDGRALYTNTCARCHGAEGAGGLPLFDGGPSPRNFRDAKFQLAMTDDQIKLTVVNGKGTGMPPFGSMFTDAQLAAIVLHVRSFDPQRGK